MVTTRHNSSLVSCEVPPYYSDVENTARCDTSRKKFCRSCCVLTISPEPASPVVYRPVNTYRQGVSSNKDERYLLDASDFVFYQQVAVAGIFPNTGAFGSDVSVQLSESLTTSTVFFSNDIKVRFHIQDDDQARTINVRGKSILVLVS